MSKGLGLLLIVLGVVANNLVYLQDLWLGQGYISLDGWRAYVGILVSLAIIVVFGGATLFFHNPTFIKWKPTALYWMFAAVLAGSTVVFRRNLIRKMLEAQIRLPDAVWARLNAAWAAFFALMGVLNLYVAYSFSEEFWVNFKLFGGMGLMFAFVLGQGFYLSRHIEEEAH